MRCRALVLLSLALGSPAPRVVLAEGPAPALRWREEHAFPVQGEATSLALDPRRGWLAVGDEAGAWLREGSGAPRRVVHRGPALDLAFGSEGQLFVATSRGLFERGAGGRVYDRSPGPGERSRAVRRLALLGDLVAAATEGGAYLSEDSLHWFAVRGPLPRRPVEAVALRKGDRGVELWLIVGGAPYRCALEPGAGGLSRAKAEPVSVVGSGRRALDLVLDAPGAEVAILAPDRLLLSNAGSWRALPLRLPPGSATRRLFSAAGALWIATDRGLLWAGAPEGPWRRAGAPAGSTPVFALAGDRTRLLAAGARGLLEGRPAHPTASAPLLDRPGREDPLADDEPSVAEVHRAALRYTELGTERIRAIREGVARRGWLPTLDLRASRSGGRSLLRDHDEVFSSGALRTLRDHERDRERDFDFAVTLRWNFGDAAYHPESIDVSREARAVIELRDDILDEITQLYYERRRVLLSLARRPGPEGDEARRLKLQADELAAGLDAWTGGWFGRRVPRLAVPVRSSPRDSRLENGP